MIRRQAHTSVAQWVSGSARKPLLVRGPRRVGKTGLMKSMGSRYFDWTLHVDFFARPEFASAFGTTRMSEVLQRLQTLSGVRIRPGRTLIFLDELQACPEARAALPELARARPDLHVAACDRALEADGETMGAEAADDVTSLYLQPLSFREFLCAVGQEKLDAYLADLPPAPLHRSVTAATRRYLRDYLLVGGMPEAVSSYAGGASTWDLERCHHRILDTIQADFSRLGSHAQRKYLNEVFHAAPRLVGRTCKYSQINGDMQSRDLKRALNTLWAAGCVHPVYHTPGIGPALGRRVNARKFHLLYTDLGLMGRALSLRSRIMGADKLLELNDGGPARQFVGQQLMAGLPGERLPRLFFWAREARNSNARVDFLAPLGDRTIPVVVREGKRGTLKSLDIFLEEHPDTPLALRFSEDELHFEDRVLTLPLFLAPYWASLVKKVL